MEFSHLKKYTYVFFQVAQCILNLVKGSSIYFPYENIMTGCFWEEELENQVGRKNE